MVSTESSGPTQLDLQAILATLESKNSNADQILQAYHELCKHIKDGEPTLFYREIVQHGPRLVAVSKRDAKGKGDVIATRALNVMWYCLSDKDIIR